MAEADILYFELKSALDSYYQKLTKTMWVVVENNFVLIKSKIHLLIYEEFEDIPSLEIRIKSSSSQRK